MNGANDSAYKVNIKINRNIKTFIVSKINYHCYQKEQASVLTLGIST